MQAYHSGFSGLKGEVIDVGTQSKGYACSVKLLNAEEGVITRFDEGEDSLFTWTNKLFAEDNFTKAKLSFKKFYTEVKGTKFTVDNKLISLKADYTEPDENVGLASIIFYPDPEVESLKNVVVDLTLSYVNEEWEISLSIYDNTMESGE